MKQPVNFSSARVLLAHGNKTTIKLYESILRGFGIKRIETAIESREAVASLQSGRIDVAILDQSIGVHDTRNIIRLVRHGETPTTREVPILLTYGHSRRRDIFTMRDSGASMIMTLPLTIEGIYERLSWLALTPRPFVTGENYTGPCRRHLDDPIMARKGRRSSDRHKDFRRAN